MGQTRQVGLLTLVDELTWGMLGFMATGTDTRAAKIRVALADDERFVRRALASYFADQPDIEVIGEAADGRDAVDLARELTPDVLLLDLQMPELDGLEATREIVQSGVPTKVLIVTGHVTDAYLTPVLVAGASGYVVKDSEPEAIIGAVREVVAGGCPVDPSVTRHLVDAVRSHGGDTTGPGRNEAAERVELSPREKEVVSLLCDGRNTREIAQELFLAEPTVKYYLSGLMTKFGARDRVQLVIAALRGGHA